MTKRNAAIYLGFGACAFIAMAAIFLIKIKPNRQGNQALERESNANDVISHALNKQTAGSTSVIQATHPGSERLVPEPPAKPWKCTFHEKLPDHLKEQPPSPRIPSGEQLDTDPKTGKSSFRSPEIPIPFAEFEHKIRLNDANVLFVWAATEKTLPAIDLQHQRVVQPVFGSVDAPAGSHYVFSIRDSESDEITVISIPIPKDLMVEVLGWLEPQAPGWIAINTRKDGASSPTPGWLHISLDE
jgi:hypothetical protein